MLYLNLNVSYPNEIFKQKQYFQKYLLTVVLRIKDNSSNPARFEKHLCKCNVLVLLLRMIQFDQHIRDNVFPVLPENVISHSNIQFVSTFE